MALCAKYTHPWIAGILADEHIQLAHEWKGVAA
jgi:hypothetical protein